MNIVHPEPQIDFSRLFRRRQAASHCALLDAAISVKDLVELGKQPLPGWWLDVLTQYWIHPKVALVP